MVSPTDPTGDVVRAYLAGDSLRSIAAAANLGSYQTLRLLSSRIADRGEMERSRSLRRRCFSTAEVLQKEKLLVGQLQDSGKARSNIPKILAALGTSVDIDIAVELLRDPERLFADTPTLDRAGPGPLTDKFSLLYVTGHLRGVEPDYKFALAAMPVSEISELRGLLQPGLHHGQIAEILAMIETTAQAIRAGHVGGISYSDYVDMAELISLRLGESADASGLWPLPAKDVRRRLGQGFWDLALGVAGLKLPRSADRFSPADYLEAAKSFQSSFRNDGHFGSPKDVASYDSWLIAETAARRDRPSVVAIRRHFGTWESVIGAAMPPEVEDEFDGIVDMYKAENSLEEGWARAGELVSEVLANMPWNSFLSIQYGDNAEGRMQPYAQASPSADGVWCEIVSEEYLPADQWPIRTEDLIRDGWSAPDSDVPNWHKEGVPPIEAGHQILEGLRDGRCCDDPTKLRWHAGEFPDGPGPDGGVTLDDALSGMVQTLRNAS